LKKAAVGTPVFLAIALRTHIGTTNLRVVGLRVHDAHSLTVSAQLVLGDRFVSMD